MKNFLKAILWIPGIFCSLSFHNTFHPFYLSVTEIELNNNRKTAQMSCRMFTDDVQAALYAEKGKNIQLQQQSAANKAALQAYVQAHLKVWANEKPLSFEWLGYEVREESVWCYFETHTTGNETKVKIENTLLCDHIAAQSNIIHCTLQGNRESYRLICPDSKVTFPLH